MAWTNPDGHTLTHIFTHTYKHQTEVVTTISRSPPAGATKKKQQQHIT